MSATAKSIQPQSIGSKIDQFYELREQKKELASKVKDIEEMMAVLEAEVLEDLDAQETTLSRGHKASASVSTSTVANVIDWDKFYEYLVENDALYLLQRRVANAPWNELRNAGEEIPGTEPFTKRSISVRKVTQK